MAKQKWEIKQWWIPLNHSLQVLEAKFKQTQDLLSSFAEAVSKAKEGMKSTKELVSKRGRSSRLGNRSVGAQDPGATSAYLILSTFLGYIEDLSSKAS